MNRDISRATALCDRHLSYEVCAFHREKYQEEAELGSSVIYIPRQAQEDARFSQWCAFFGTVEPGG